MKTKKVAGAIRRYEDAAHAAGSVLARNTRQALYGTRYSVDSDAGTAPARGTFGKGLHSVWQGPTQVKSGAPVLVRDKAGG